MLGANPAWDAVSKMASLKALCLLILSPPTPTAKGMVAKDIAVAKTGRAGALPVKDGQSQAIFGC